MRLSKTYLVASVSAVLAVVAGATFAAAATSQEAGKRLAAFERAARASDALPEVALRGSGDVGEARRIASLSRTRAVYLAETKDAESICIWDTAANEEVAAIRHLTSSAAAP